MKKNGYIKLCLLIGLFFVGADFVHAAEEVSCGGISGIPAALPTFVRNIINVVKVLVPVILIILGMLDFAKAVMSNDEKAMKESQSKFIRRILAGLIIFFVIVVVQFVFGMVETDDNVLGCVRCFISDSDGCR